MNLLKKVKMMGGDLKRLENDASFNISRKYIGRVDRDGNIWVCDRKGYQNRLIGFERCEKFKLGPREIRSLAKNLERLEKE